MLKLLDGTFYRLISIPFMALTFLVAIVFTLYGWWIGDFDKDPKTGLYKFQDLEK